MRITPENITTLENDDIFCFGSNEAGIHGAGAALFATKFGASFMQGFGLSGKTFAIPTKDWEIEQLPLDIIEQYVKAFIRFTQVEDLKECRFLVTAIGCGLAGYTAEDIAPMFEEVLDQENVWLPQSFVDVLVKHKEERDFVNN